MGRPIGLWIVTVYLLALLALGATFIAVAVRGGSFQLDSVRMIELTTVLSSFILLLVGSRWAVLAIGLMTVLQASAFLAHLGAEGTSFIEVKGSDAVVYVVSFTYIYAPLLLMAATGAALLYTTWLWRAGVLR